MIHYFINIFDISCTVFFFFLGKTQFFFRLVTNHSAMNYMSRLLRLELRLCLVSGLTWFNFPSLLINAGACSKKLVRLGSIY